MDHVERLVVLRTETAAFEQAVRRAFDLGEPVPAVPSCPGWSVTDLVRHLGGVHRYLAHVLRERLTVPPDPAGLTPPEPPDSPDPLTDRFVQGAPEPAGRRLHRGAGERYRFRRTDGPESWTVRFSGDQVLLETGSTAPADVEAAGTA
ncbi:maleylpyruvate isomerase N-terminal domain-containing protein [Streptomyces virginiae]|uniref:maleylpyruvate isomerase N-terminal domain-containing protein n=2 Tax=Streptomyces virginiae TaxID=1961 RepID=UPI0036541E4F